MPKMIIILCSRCGAKRRKKDYKKKPNGEIYKICNNCREKIFLKKNNLAVSLEEPAVLAETPKQEETLPNPISTHLQPEPQISAEPAVIPSAEVPNVQTDLIQQEIEPVVDEGVTDMNPPISIPSEQPWASIKLETSPPPLTFHWIQIIRK